MVEYHVKNGPRYKQYRRQRKRTKRHPGEEGYSQVSLLVHFRSQCIRRHMVSAVRQSCYRESQHLRRLRCRHNLREGTQLVHVNILGVCFLPPSCAAAAPICPTATLTRHSQLPSSPRRICRAHIPLLPANRYLEADPMLLVSAPGSREERTERDSKFHSLNQAIVQLVS